MVCPQCEAIEAEIDQKSVQKELRNYRKNGPAKTTSLLINHLKSVGIEDLSLLDIGGGLGVIQLELLKSGITSAINVEASSAYIEAAQEEAERHGLTARTSFHHGDYVDLSPNIPIADVVTLDRVICCYPYLEPLVENSITHARNLYGLVYPRDVWWTKGYTAIYNFFQWVKRKKFRLFVHPKEGVHAVVQAHNFKRCYYRNSGFWLIEIFKRIEKNDR